MKTISKILITALAAISISPAAYAADESHGTGNCPALKYGSNVITYNSKINQLCINGKCVKPDTVIGTDTNGCAAINILSGIFGNCPDFPIKPPSDSSDLPGDAEMPEDEPTASEKPESAPTPAPTEEPEVIPTAAPSDEPESAPTAAPTEIPSQTPGTPSNISAAEREVFTLVNQVRTENGLSALTWADDLADVARAHSRDMINRGFFSHTNPDGYSPFDRLRNNGISYRTAAENIAYGQKTAAAVMNAWMNSSGHRANILNANVKEIGVGAATAANGMIYWTQMFVAR